MRALIIHTGGTIGMVPTPQGLAPARGFEAAVRAALPADQAFDWLEFETLLDSSNMGPHEWNLIGEAVARGLEDHDGVVVLHGTDTMAYTASALSFMLEGLGRPVVLTGSQRPLLGEHSDAPGNLALALKAATGGPNEVMLAFGGRLLRGNRTLKVHTGDDAGFDSPDHPGLDMAAPHTTSETPFSLKRASTEKVALLRVYPGMGDAELAALHREGVRGLVIECFGAGNLPSRSPAFMAALEAFACSGALIGATSECRAGAVHAGLYEAGSALARLGIVPLEDMTTPCAVAKIGWLLSREMGMDERRALLATPLRGEMGQ